MSDLSISWPGYKTDIDGVKDPVAVKVSTPGTGKVLRAFGDEITVLLSGADTGGLLAMCIDVTPPAGGPPPHYHREDETFHILEGDLEFLIDGEWQAVPVGATVFVPGGTVHSFRNSGSEPSKMLVQKSPAGFEIYFERCAAVFAEPGPPDMARIMQISAEHGINFVMD